MFRLYKNGEFQGLVNETREETLDALVGSKRFMALAETSDGRLSYAELSDTRDKIVNVYTHVPAEAA